MSSVMRKSVSSMMSLVLQDCRRAFPRRLQDRLHRVASVDLAAQIWETSLEIFSEIYLAAADAED